MKDLTEPHIKKKEIAKYLGFSTKTMERWVDQGCPCFVGPNGEQTFQINAVTEWAANKIRTKKESK